MKEYYSVDEISNILGRHRNTIIRYIKDGRLKAIKPGNIYLIPREEVDRFLIISELRANGMTTKQAEDYIKQVRETKKAEEAKKEKAMVDLMNDIFRVASKQAEEEYKNVNK